MKKKIVSLFTAVIMLFTLIPTTFAAQNNSLDNFSKTNTYRQGQFTDVSSSVWYCDTVAQVYELGLMKGNGDGTFNPKGYITEAEAITIAARIHKIYTTGNDNFSDIKQEMKAMEPTILEWCGNDKTNPAYKEFFNAWYSPYAYYYSRYIQYQYPEDDIDNWDNIPNYNYVLIYPFLGTVPEHATSLAQNTITRKTFVEIMAQALPESEFTQINTVETDSIPDITYSESFEVYQFYRAGVLTGSDSVGTFNPKTSISRAEVAAIITRMVQPSLRQHITLNNSQATKDMITVSSSSVTIQKTTSITVSVYYDTNKYPDGITLNAEYDSNIVNVEWGEWDGWTTSLKIIPVANGTTTIKIYASEAQNEYQEISVTVSGQSSQASAENNNSKYIKLAKDGYALLYSMLKNPSSLQINGIYGGQGNMFYGNKYRDVVMIDYSAMNGFGGYSRSYFMVWYADDGVLCYDNETYYPPSTLKDLVIISIEDVV